MAIVTVNQGESIESALRRFKRKVMTEEIIKDAKKHAFFIPPGQKAKLKSALFPQVDGGQAPAKQTKKASMSASVPVSPSQLKSALPQGAPATTAAPATTTGSVGRFPGLKSPTRTFPPAGAWSRSNQKL